MERAGHVFLMVSHATHVQISKAPNFRTLLTLARNKVVPRLNVHQSWLILYRMGTVRSFHRLDRDYVNKLQESNISQHANLANVFRPLIIESQATALKKWPNQHTFRGIYVFEFFPHAFTRSLPWQSVGRFLWRVFVCRDRSLNEEINCYKIIINILLPNWRLIRQSYGKSSKLT